MSKIRSCVIVGVIRCPRTKGFLSQQKGIQHILLRDKKNHSGQADTLQFPHKSLLQLCADLEMSNIITGLFMHNNIAMALSKHNMLKITVLWNWMKAFYYMLLWVKQWCRYAIWTCFVIMALRKSSVPEIFLAHI